MGGWRSESLLFRRSPFPERSIATSRASSRSSVIGGRRRRPRRLPGGVRHRICGLGFRRSASGLERPDVVVASARGHGRAGDGHRSQHGARPWRLAVHDGLGRGAGSSRCGQCAPGPPSSAAIRRHPCAPEVDTVAGIRMLTGSPLRCRRIGADTATITVARR